LQEHNIEIIETITVT